jgi:hypothetical protein
MPIRTIVAAVLLAFVTPCPRAWSADDTAEVRSVAELLEAMASGEYQTRRKAVLDDPGTAPYAARGLAHGGRREAWDAICTAYRRDVENPYAADLIPEALVELDPERAEAFLLDVFADAPDTALFRIGGPDARAAIARRVTDEGEEDVSRQPRTMSSVWAFPWNVRVSAMALWALAVLDEGRPPFPVEELSTFPPGRPSDWERGARARFEAADR